MPYNKLILFNHYEISNPSQWDIYVMDQTGANQTLINSTTDDDESLIDTYWWDS